MKVTSSLVVSKALGISADGVPSTMDGNCGYCGLEIKKGDLVTPFVVGPGFMDTLTLAYKDSEMCCGHCSHHTSAEGLRLTGHGVFSEDEGFKPFRKWGDVREALLNPPKGRFVMTYATANNQHMAWRSIVNESQDLFYVRVGLRNLKIRRQFLIDAVDVCYRVAIKMGYKDDGKRKTLLNPFSSLSSDLKDASHANLNRAMTIHENAGFEHLKDDQEYQKDLQFLKQLTLGETWGLRFVLTPNAGQ